MYWKALKYNLLSAKTWSIFLLARSGDAGVGKQESANGKLAIMLGVLTRLLPAFGRQPIRWLMVLMTSLSIDVPNVELQHWSVITTTQPFATVHHPFEFLLLCTQNALIVNIESWLMINDHSMIPYSHSRIHDLISGNRLFIILRNQSSPPV